MVKIRLKRIGAKKRPVYRIVVTKSTAPRDGTAIETIGSYNPVSQPKHISIQEDRALYWMLNGAQPTDTVAYLLKKEGVLDKFFEQRPGARGKFSMLDKRTDVMTRKTMVGSTAATEPAPTPEAEAVAMVEAPVAEPVSQEPTVEETQVEPIQEVAEVSQPEEIAIEETPEVAETLETAEAAEVATEESEPEQAAAEKE